MLFANPCGFKVTVYPLVPKTPVLAERVWVELKVFVICWKPPFSHKLLGIFKAAISGVGPKTRITVEESVPSERVTV